MQQDEPVAGADVTLLPASGFEKSRHAYETFDENPTSLPGFSGDDSLPTCKPIILKIMSGAHHLTPDRTVACLCNENAADLLTRLVSAVEDAIPGFEHSASILSTSFLLRASHHAHPRMICTGRDGIASCLLQIPNTHSRTEDLLSLSQFKEEVKDMGCHCTEREIRLIVLENSSLATMRSCVEFEM